MNTYPEQLNRLATPYQAILYKMESRKSTKGTKGLLVGFLKQRDVTCASLFDVSLARLSS